MERPVIVIYDADSGIVTEREMTDSEFRQYKSDQETSRIFAAELAATRDARMSAIAKLVSLGLTESEVSSLIGGAQ